MFQRRRGRVLLAVFVVSALVLVTLDFRSGDDGPLGRLRGGVTAVFRPIQDGVVTIVRPLGDAVGGVTDLFSVRADNVELRRRVEQLEDRRRSMTDLERENGELRELLAIRDRNDLDAIAARTVALAPSNFEWTITIDVGSEDGVERDMPVINGAGLVGRIIQVTPNASRVLLAIDPNFAAAARTARTGEIGPIDGRGGDPMVLRLLDPDGDVQVGDEIVTSSYQGGVFPGGLPIGTVSAVLDAPSRLTREVQVSPFVDFTRLHHVLVVRSSPVEQIPAFEDSEGLEFRRPPVDPTQGPDPDGPEPDDESDADADADSDADEDDPVDPQATGDAAATDPP